MHLFGFAFGIVLFKYVYYDNMRSKEGSEVVLDGEQDVDTAWLAAVVDASQHCETAEDVTLCQGIEVIGFSLSLSIT